MRVLVLGGTAEARTLAERLHHDVDVISSLAGRVPNPVLPVGQVRVGGFGGAEPMRRWLVDNGVDAVVDATHPFAAAMTERAVRVCGELGLRHVVLRRPGWDPGGAQVVADNAAAAKAVAQRGFSRVFLTSGRSSVGAFADNDAWFLIRVVTAPDPRTLPRRHALLLSRGPYRYDDELALMRDHRIRVLVTKNSGGELTRPKIDAAAELDIPVVMVDRPPLPPGAMTVGTVDEAVAWVANGQL
jgi:precorrin-6A/cobalt-precorrin-6A reductase